MPSILGIRLRQRLVLAILGATAIILATFVPPGLASAATTHGGAGWNVSLSEPAILSTGAPGNAANGTLACPSASVCYLVGHDSSGNGYVLTTSDSGSTWGALSVPSGDSFLTGIDCPPPSTSTCYVTGIQNSAAFILKTTDSGSTWSNVSVPSGLETVSGIACPSLNTCYLNGYDPSGSNPTGGDVVASTTDGGTSWGLLTFPSVFIPNGPIACPSTSTCYAVGNDSDPNQIYLLTTTDSGTTWTQESFPPATSGFFGSPIACPSTTTCYVSAMNEAAKDKVMMYATTNSGNSWVSQAMPRLTGPQAAIACLSDSVCYGAGSSSISPLNGEAQIVVTTDSGATWHRQNLPTGTAFLSAAVCPSMAMCFVQGSTTGTRGAVVLAGDILNITTASLPNGSIGQPYSTTLAATGGTSSYHWKIVSGSSLPLGLRLNGTTGTIFGKPTGGSSTFTVQVQDTRVTNPIVKNTATATFTITIAGGA